MHNDTNTQCEKFLNLRLGLGLDFVVVCLFRFIVYVIVFIVRISLDQFIPVLFAIVVFGL